MKKKKANKKKAKTITRADFKRAINKTHTLRQDLFDGFISNTEYEKELRQSGVLIKKYLKETGFVDTLFNLNARDGGSFSINGLFPDTYVHVEQVYRDGTIRIGIAK